MLAKVLRIVNMYTTLTLILVLLTPSRAYAEELAPEVEEGIIVCIDDRRTLSNIVWSCLATVFGLHLACRTSQRPRPYHHEQNNSFRH